MNERDNIGKQATIQHKHLKILVKILDVKFSYGHWRYAVSPIAGSGIIWTQNISIIEKTTQ